MQLLVECACVFAMMRDSLFHSKSSRTAPVTGRPIYYCCDADVPSSGRCTVTCFSAACRSISLRRLRKNCSLSGRVSSSLSASMAVTLQDRRRLDQVTASHRSHDAGNLRRRVHVLSTHTAGHGGKLV